MHLRIVALALFSLALAGCGSNTGSQSQEQSKQPQDATEAIRGLIADVPDKTSSPIPAKQLFMNPPPAGQLKRYAANSYEVVGSAQMSGDTATARVKVTTDDGKESEVEWSFVKDGEHWKLKDAPLP